MDKEELETSEELIKECIKDIYVNPRNAIRKWSKITNQTAQGKFAYPSQHLASLITGKKGRGTAARGDDLSDGSEVKSCSKADQLNECKKCGSKVLTWQKECPKCKSDKILIKEDSHWIFPIRSKNELHLLLKKIPRIILIMFDKEDKNSENVRIRAWNVNPNIKYVQDFFKQYFYKNYTKKMKKGETPAPCNLHPLKYDFYMMQPKLIFHAKVNANKNNVEILFWNLKNPKVEEMPTHFLKQEQMISIFGKEVKKMNRKETLEKFKTVSLSKMNKLFMKKKITKTYKKAYRRR